MNEVFQAEFRELPEVPSIPVYESTTKAVSDGKLSLKAMALHTFIRGLRSWYKRTTGKEWSIYAGDISKRVHMTRKTIGKLITELVETGYMDRHRKRQGRGAKKGQSGLFGGYTYIVYCMQKKEWSKHVKQLSP